MSGSIAIVGSGISGLTAAYLLARRHEVTVFEASDWIGGHTHTVEMAEGDRRVAMDTGFIVYDERTCPNFCRLLRPRFWSMLRDILRFYREAPRLRAVDDDAVHLTPAGFLARRGHGEAFVEDHLLPVLAAIWSAGRGSIGAFTLPEPAPVTLTIHDAAGRRVRTLVSGSRLDAGEHRRRFDGRDEAGRALASGVYLARLAAGDRVEVKRLVLVR